MEAAERSLGFFIFYYLQHYLRTYTPDFHKEIYEDLQDWDIHFLELIAFRDSAKSTLASLALPLWAAIFKKRNFIILCSDTFAQAKQNITNLISELEDNERIKEDFGSFKTKKEEWSATGVILKNSVRIVSKSKGQKIRGLRHMEFRPDLVVCDDIENPDDVRTKEQRDKTEEWLLSDVMPAVDGSIGKLVLSGSLLHSDSVVSRIKERGIATLREYPLIKDDVCLWPEKFSPEKIAEIKKRNERFFLREYLLKLVPEEGQVVKQVHYYTKADEIHQIAIGTDLAISKKETADYTAFDVAGLAKDGNIYNLYTYYARMQFNETLAKLDEIYTSFKQQYPNKPITVGWEDVAYQRAGAEEATRRYKMPILLIKRSNDKRSRLQTIEPHLSTGHVKFRERGDEDTVIQTLNFGVEAHDDLMDAMEMAVSILITKRRPSIGWV